MVAPSPAKNDKSTRQSPQTIGLREFAETIGISYSTAHAAAQRGALPCPVIRVGATYRIARRHVDRLLGLDDDPSFSLDDGAKTA